MLSGQHSTWLEIDLSAIQNNIRRIRAITNRPVMPVIKANAYGHGLVEVAQAAASAGADWLGVARIEEALRLRQKGVGLPILVLGLCLPEHVPEAIAHGVSLTIFRPDMIADFAAQAQAEGQPLAVHAKIDTGMGRLGVFPKDGLAFIRCIKEHPSLALEGIFTHLARADEPEVDTTDWQMERFGKFINTLEGEGLRPRWVHAANSAAALYFPGTRFDLVRPGISIYGLQPSPAAALPSGFRAALSWKAHLASIKEIPADQGISYNYQYITRTAERIGVIPVGYADGFRRAPGNFVLAGGRRVPVVGAVCMDQSMVRLDEVPQVGVGDEVVMLGNQGQASITVEQVAQTWGTVTYEVVCGLAARLPRIYHA